MKKSFIFISLFLVFAIFQACDKKSIIDDLNYQSNHELQICSYEDHFTGHYVLNGTYLNKEDIDYTNENLTLVEGYGKDIYVFYSDEDMYRWASSIEALKDFAQSIKNLQTAKNYAIATGQYGLDEPSPEYLKYLEENFNTNNKSGGIMFEEFYFQGWNNYMYPFPKPTLKSEYDNELSSLRTMVNSYRLFDGKWWKGFSKVFITIVYNEWEVMKPEINDKTSSYWAF